MKIAYIILAHKLPAQLVRLVKRLDAPGTHFFIHIDKNSDNEVYKQIVSDLSLMENIFFLKRFVTKWGQVGCVQAMLEGIRAIIDFGIDFDYAINLSGQDYPIKSNRQIQEYLQEKPDNAYLNYTSIPYSTHKHIDDWIQSWHFYLGEYHIVFPKQRIFSNNVLNKMWNPFVNAISVRRKLPFSYKPYYGGAYWCLPKANVKYINNFTNDHRNYIKWFAHVRFPDEFFFQTLLKNSPFQNHLINDDMRYIDFSQRKAHPKTLTMNDFEKFMSTHNLFARKFDLLVDAEVLDRIDQEIS